MQTKQVAPKHYCQQSCSYCDYLHPKKNLPTSASPSRNVLPCNTVYFPNQLRETLLNKQDTELNINLENDIDQTRHCLLSNKDYKFQLNIIFQEFDATKFEKMASFAFIAPIKRIIIIVKKGLDWNYLRETLPAEYFDKIELYCPDPSDSDESYLSCDEIYQLKIYLKEIFNGLEFKGTNFEFKNKTPQALYRSTLNDQLYLENFAKMGRFYLLRSLISLSFKHWIFLPLHLLFLPISIFLWLLTDPARSKVMFFGKFWVIPTGSKRLVGNAKSHLVLGIWKIFELSYYPIRKPYYFLCFQFKKRILLK